MKILSLDIGNTRATLGFFCEGELAWRRDMLTEALCSGIEAFVSDSPDICVVSCVAQRASFFAGRLRQQLHRPVLEVDPKRAPIVLHYDHPEKLGQDRIANALAAGLYTDCGAIVADLGTATHFDTINPDGEFLGGPILAGIETMFDALAQRIPHLPRLEAEHFELDPVSKNTASAIQTGTILCMAGGVERIIAEIRKSVDFECRVILTGGYASLVAPYVAHDFIVPDLTLEGLCEYGMRVVERVSRRNIRSA
ncbi:MAG: type III pantothenate kinase [Proteobacteria bacterium]|nr:type III pantothenate kinase [Pseudomonadota bacterium]